MKKLSFLMIMAIVIIMNSCTKTNLQPLVQPASIHSQEVSQATTPATSFHTNEQIDIDAELYNECSAEWVHFTGNYQIISNYTINGNKVSGVTVNNTKNVAGVGETSGIHYVGIEVISVPFSGSLVNGVYTSNFVSRGQMVSKNGSANFVIKQTGHLTINANGVMTVSYDNYSLECR